MILTKALKLFLSRVSELNMGLTPFKNSMGKARVTIPHPQESYKKV